MQHTVEKGKESTLITILLEKENVYIEIFPDQVNTVVYKDKKPVLALTTEK